MAPAAMATAAAPAVVVVAVVVPGVALAVVLHVAWDVMMKLQAAFSPKLELLEVVVAVLLVTVSAQALVEPGTV